MDSKVEPRPVQGRHIRLLQVAFLVLVLVIGTLIYNTLTRPDDPLTRLGLPLERDRRFIHQEGERYVTYYYHHTVDVLGEFDSISAALQKQLIPSQNWRKGRKILAPRLDEKRSDTYVGMFDKWSIEVWIQEVEPNRVSIFLKRKATPNEERSQKLKNMFGGISDLFVQRRA